MLPGWYGFGSAVKKWLAEHPTPGLSLLQAMADDGRFSRHFCRTWTWIGESDIAIAGRYKQLVDTLRY